MKIIFLLAILNFGALICNKSDGKIENRPKFNVEPSNLVETVISDNFIKPNYHWVVGEFDGEGTIDTVYEHVYSKKHKREIDSVPNIDNGEFNEIMKWYIDQNTDLLISIKYKEKSTLHLGLARGLYCLINIGDINHDGKDEIAIVIDYFDESKLNSCKIYTLCNRKWKLLHQFTISENAFDMTEENSKFNQIDGYLECKNEIWHYLDMENEFNDKDEASMEVLKISTCE
jgi:hypothetical protein